MANRGPFDPRLFGLGRCLEFVVEADSVGLAVELALEVVLRTAIVEAEHGIGQIERTGNDLEPVQE